MANTQCIPTPTKQAWQQRATPTTDTYKAALYTNVGTLGPTSTVYTTSGEVTGTNYTAGGVTLSGATISTSGTSAYITFSSPITFTNVTLSGVTSVVIYNTSKSNEIVGIYTFASQSPTAQNLVLTLPAAGGTAVVRID